MLPAGVPQVSLQQSPLIASLELAAALDNARRSPVLVCWLFDVHEDQWIVWLQPESIHWAEAGLRSQCHPVQHFHC